jgi:GNAT superfamily N-acetyltransferase
MDVLIRSARVDGAPRILALIEGGALADSPHPLTDAHEVEDAVREIIETECCDVLVATLDGEVVGVAQLMTFRHLQHRGGRCAEIESMHVDDAHRGRGVGALLLEALVTAAGERGCYRVQLTSNKQRGDAHRFYERNGFSATHEGFKRYLTG